MEINIQLETCGNAIKYCWVQYPTSDANIQALVTATKAAGMNAGYYTSHSRRNTAYGAADLMTATGRAAVNDVDWSNQLGNNGDTAIANSAGYYQFNLSDAIQSNITYKITQPKLLLNCIDVEPAVNAALIEAAKDPRDGFSCVHRAEVINGKFL